VRVGTSVIVFTLIASVFAGLVSSLLPIVYLGRPNPARPRSEDGFAPIDAGRAPRLGRTRGALIVGQMAIACVLLIGASLLGRSFLALMNADRGYNPAGVLTARVFLPGSVYSPERRYAIVRAVFARLKSMGVTPTAGLTSELPVTPGGSTAAFTLQSRHGVIDVQVSPRLVSAGAFSALGMRILEGRDFTELDDETAPPVAIVNRTFARRYLPSAAIGAKLPMGIGYRDPTENASIIGVVDDVRYVGAATLSMPEIYYSYRQFKGQLPVPSVTFLARTSTDSRALTAKLRTSIREADETLVPDAILTMEDRVLTGLARPRLYMILFGGFASLALAVVAVGLFAVLSHAVVQRSRELAIRSALGARLPDILRLIARESLAIVAVGSSIGIGAAALMADSMASFVYGVTPHDRLTYVVVPVLLLVVAALASLGPIIRAVRVDPVTVLRSS
jgi:putative ABC transport system permease protein